MISKKNNEFIKSHIYQKSLLLVWLKDCLKQSLLNPKELIIYKIDLTTKDKNPTVLKDTDDIKDFLEKDKFFYFEYLADKVKQYEEFSWNKNIEQKFLITYNEIRKNLLNETFKIKSKSKQEKIIKNIIETKHKKLIILEWIQLTLFRSKLFRPLSKVINSYYGTEEITDITEILNNAALSVKDAQNWDEIFEKFKKNYDFINWEFYYFFGFNSPVMFNPPIHHMNQIFFIIPILGLGYVYLIKPGYLIKIDKTYEMLEIKLQKNINDWHEKYIKKDCFLFLKSTALDSNFMYDFLSNIMLSTWISNIGFSRGYIYYISNNGSNFIDDFIAGLEDFNVFEFRNKYLLNKDNFNKNKIIMYKKIITK